MLYRVNPKWRTRARAQKGATCKLTTKVDCAKRRKKRRYMWTLNRIQSKLRRMTGDVHLMCAQRRAVHVRACAQHLCTALVPTISLHLMQHLCAALFFQCSRLCISRFSRMCAALVHSTCADNFFALDAAFVRRTFFPVQQASYIALHRTVW